MQRQQGTFLTNDGVRLAYEYAGVGFGKNNTGDSPVVLVHGWSGSKHYFDNSFSHILAGRNRPPMVVRYDLRGHGESEKPSYGYMVARFAADLRDLLDHLELDNVTLVGTSMGCAVIWSYLSLFGEGRVKAGVFVDQAPLQNRAPDWELGSRGCYDVPSLTTAPGAAQVRLRRVRKGQRGVVPEHRHRSRAREAFNRGDFEGAPGGLRADHGGPHRDRLAPVPTAHPRPVPGPRGWEIADLPGRGRQRMRAGSSNRAPPSCSRGKTIGCTSRTSCRFAELVCDFAYNGELTQGDGAPPEMPPLPMPERRRGGVGSRPGTSATVDSRFVQDMLDSGDRGSEGVQRAARALAVVPAAHEYHLASARQRHGPAGVGGEGTVAGNHAGRSAGDVQKTRFELDGHRGAGSGVGSAGCTALEGLQQAELTAHDGG